MEDSKQTKSRKAWCNSHEDFLMELWADKISGLRGVRKNSHIHKEMSEALQAVGAFYSPTEIKVKLRNLSNRYRKENRTVGLTGGSPSKWRLYQKVYFILGELRTNNLEILVEDSIMENIMPTSPSPGYCETSTSESTPTTTAPEDDLPSTSIAAKKRRRSFELNSQLQKADEVMKEQLEEILRDFVNSCDKFHSDLLKK